MAKQDKNLHSSVIFQNLSKKLEEHGTLLDDYDKYINEGVKNMNKPVPTKFTNMA